MPGFGYVEGGMQKFKSLFMIMSFTFVVLLLVELMAWGGFFFIPKPEHVYHYSYMNSYVYDPHLAFRVKEYPAYGSFQNANASSVFIIGGSTAGGVGVVRWDEAFYRILENNLIARGQMDGNRLINLAVPGYVSSQEAAVYKKYIFSQPVAPRAVVALTSFNDIYFYLFRTLDIGNHEFGNALDTLFRKGYPPPKKVSDKIRNMVRKTNVFMLFHALTAKRDEQEAVPPIGLASDFDDPTFSSSPDPIASARIEAAAQHFLENCLATGILAKHRGTRFIVVIQPNYYYGGELTVVENEWFANMPELHRWISAVESKKEAYDQFYEIVIKGLQDYQKKGYLQFKDYRTLLKNAGPVYKDPVHFNELGSKILGDQLTADLENIR